MRQTFQLDYRNWVCGLEQLPTNPQLVWWAAGQHGMHRDDSEAKFGLD